MFVGASFPEDAVEHGEPPAGWDGLDSAVARSYGDAWLRSRAALTLSVPSAIIKAERNFVLNPAHANTRVLVVDPGVEEFIFDARLLKR